jgi:hypothetical protein
MMTRKQGSVLCGRCPVSLYGAPPSELPVDAEMRFLACFQPVPAVYRVAAEPSASRLFASPHFAPSFHAEIPSSPWNSRNTAA